MPSDEFVFGVRRLHRAEALLLTVVRYSKFLMAKAFIMSGRAMREPLRNPEFCCLSAKLGVAYESGRNLDNAASLSAAQRAFDRRQWGRKPTGRRLDSTRKLQAAHHSRAPCRYCRYGRARV